VDTMTTDTTPENGAARAKPTLVETDPVVTTEPAEASAPAEEKAKRTRRSPTEEQIVEIRKLRAEGITFKDVAERTGFSVGTIQKFSKDEEPKPAKAPKAPKTPKAAKTATATPAVKAAAPSGGTDTVNAVKAAIFDLVITQGHPIAAVRGAIATYLG